MSKPLRVVALGDMHTGGLVSLADPSISPQNDPGAEIRNELFKLWEKSTQGPWAKPDVLIVNGDLIEGQNPKSGGIGLWETDLLKQAEHNIHLLKMWKAKKIFIVRGSGYHVTAGHTGLQIEEYIARRIGAEEYPNQECLPEDMRDHSGWEWYINLNGVTFHVAHKVGVSRVFHYRTTPLARQMLQAKLNDQLRHEMDKTLRIRVVIRSHAHYYITVGHSNSDGFILPCWKALDEFLIANGPLDISPDVGFVGFTLQDGRMSYDKNLWELDAVRRAPLTVIGGR